MTSNVAFHVAPIRHPAARSYDAEWRRLSRHPRALRQAATWQIVRIDLASLDEVLDAIGYERRPTPENEANLQRLLDIAADDMLAAQVVVRRLMPGALSVASRHWVRRGGEPLDELLGALWISIRTFDTARRPASLAAALLADAEYRAFHGRRRRMLREVSSNVVVEHAVPDDDDSDPAAELAELVAKATAAGLTDADDVALLRLLVNEPSPTRLARQLDVTERTIRNRRARLAAKLRTAAQAA